jgi:hypothetical protein
MILSPIIRSLSVFGAWGWVDLAGGLIVVVGCAGELWVLLNKIPEHNERRATLKGLWMIISRVESLVRPICIRLKIIPARTVSELKEHLLEVVFISLVACGVAMELMSLPFSLWEAAKIGENASNANERASTNELRVEELRKANDELELKMQPRTINFQQRESFAKFFHVSQRKPVWVLCSNPTRETSDFASEIRGMLNDAGLNVGESPFPLAVGVSAPPKDGVFIGFSIIVNGKYEQTILILVNRSDAEQGKIPEVANCLLAGFSAAGIKTAFLNSDVKPGETVVYVSGKSGF